MSIALNNQKGQALVTLLVFVAVAVTITSGAIIASVVNLDATASIASADRALRVAESGAEEAMLRIVRNPSYSGGTISLDNGTATVTVTGDTTKTVVSEGSVGKFKRKISVTGSLSNNVFTPTSWTEIP
jgi:type II secretory pathway component PulK